MKIALVSLDQVWEDKIANRAASLDYIKMASSRGCDLVVFPEMTLTGFTMRAHLHSEDRDDSETIRWFSHQATDHAVAIVFGAILQVPEGKPANTLIAVSRDGDILVTYQKIHLFSLANEHRYYSPGQRPASFSLNGQNIGTAICYDLRFAELYQYLSGLCPLVITIANWPEARIGHWEVLLQSRAIENQFFSCGVNRTGSDGNNLRYPGSSFLFDPMGQKMHPLESHHLMDIYLADLQVVEDVRKRFPFIKDRRSELFAPFGSVH